MTQDLTTHLSADELDALLEGTGTARSLFHGETCALCREMVRLDRQVIAALGSFPPIALPMRSDFEDQVMARIDLRAAPVALAESVTPRAVAARRRFIGLVLAGGTAVAAGFAWAALDPAAANGLSGAALGGVGDSLWLSLQTMVANTAEQPWFAVARDTLASPARALPFVVAGAGLYAAALAGLGRLLAEPATDAGW
jgi:hypothetical protein